MPDNTTRGAAAGVGPLNLLVVALGLVLMLPRLVGVGMFVDGVTYATLGRNLAESRPLQPWSLHYTETLHARFYDQPPLGIWLLAATFYAVGDVPWAESLHAGLLFAAFVAALVGLWRAAWPRQKVGPWLLVALTLTFPLTSWVFANNMLEAPMAIGCVLAASAWLRAWRCPTHAWLGGAVAGVALLAALLSKGPPALFVLTLPLAAHWLAPDAPARAIHASTASLTAVLGVGACLLVAMPASRTYLDMYLHQQVLNSLEGNREVATSRWLALSRLATELVGPVGLATAVLLNRRLAEEDCSRLRAAAAWTVLGLSGSLPVLLSPKQSGWYIYQSLPFFALAAASVLIPAAQRLQAASAVHAQTLQGVALAGLLGALVLTGLRWGALDKHQDFHHDFTQQPLAPMPGALVQVCPPTLVRDWALQANMARSLRASLTEAPAPWLLVDRRVACVVPPGCQAIHPPNPQRFSLYHCLPQLPATPRKHV